MGITNYELRITNSTAARNDRKQYDEPFPRGEGVAKRRMRNAGGNLIRRTSPCLHRTPCLSLWERWPSVSEVGEGANPQRTSNTLSVTANAVPALPEGEPRAPAALFHPLLPSVGVRWRDGDLGRCASIGPYETVEARTCTANRIFARIPHPALRATFPPGEGFVVLLPVIWGAGGGKAPQALLALHLGELARR